MKQIAGFIIALALTGLAACDTHPRIGPLLRSTDSTNPSTTSTPTGPVIQSFQPTAGPVGTKIIIQGSGFGSSPTDVTAMFGQTPATVEAVTATALALRVPQEATSSNITISVGGKTVRTQQPFTILFSKTEYSNAIVDLQGVVRNVTIDHAYYALDYYNQHCHTTLTSEAVNHIQDTVVASDTIHACRTCSGSDTGTIIRLCCSPTAPGDEIYRLFSADVDTSMGRIRTLSMSVYELLFPGGAVLTISTALTLHDVPFTMTPDRTITVIVPTTEIAQHLQTYSYSNVWERQEWCATSMADVERLTQTVTGLAPSPKDGFIRITIHR